MSNPALVAKLDDQEETEQVRHYVVRALGRTHHPDALHVLSLLLQDRHVGAQYRADAALALGVLGDSGCVAPLVEALHDKEDSVRALAATGLGLLGEDRAVVPLLAVLVDVDEYVRICALSALGAIGDRRAVEPLGRILRGHVSATEYEREQAARALGIIGGEDAHGVLSTVDQDDVPETVRKQIEKALVRFPRR